MPSLSATDCLRAVPGGLIYKTNPDLLWLIFCQYALQLWLSVKSVGHKIALAQSVTGWRWPSSPGRREWEIGPGGPARPVLLTGPLTISLSLLIRTGNRIIPNSASSLGQQNIYARDHCLQIYFTTVTVESFSKVPVDVITASTRSFWFSLFTTIIKFPGTPESISSGNSFESCFCIWHPLDRSSEIELLIWITSSNSLQCTLEICHRSGSGGALQALTNMT